MTRRSAKASGCAIRICQPPACVTSHVRVITRTSQGDRYHRRRVAEICMSPLQRRMHGWPCGSKLTVLQVTMIND